MKGYKACYGVHMSRQARLKSSTKIYHVVQSGLQDRSIIESDADKAKILEIIVGRTESHGFDFIGYCILDDHFHLIVKEANTELPRIMQCIQVRYARYYNATYGTAGPVFKERYQSEPIEDPGALKAVLRFVNLTPLRKGIMDAFDYQWTSYHEYLTTEKYCNTKLVLESFSSDIEIAKDNFRSYSEEINDDQFLENKIDLNAYKLIKGTIEAEDCIISYLDKYDIKLADLKLPAFKSHRNALIVYLKDNSTLSIRGISNLLGIGRSIIERAK